MKKTGFTLSELIVSLSIIGIASALMMPAISKLVPDRNKTKVISIQSKLVSAVDNLLDDDMIYWCLDNEDKEGLSCEGMPTIQSNFHNENFRGSQKFENLMVRQLGLEDAASVIDRFRYRTPDGVNWRFERGCSNNNGTFAANNGACAVQNTLTYRITVDLNGTAARAAGRNPNRIYGQNGEQKPDQFRFRVDNYGGITPEDALTAAYLRNAFKSADKKNDKDVAAELLQRNARYRAF